MFAICALLSVMTIFSIDAMAAQPRPGQRRQGRPHHGGSVGAPLDGGLLTVLGAAGVAYVVARKKKKNSDK
ncbi:MAG: hypothetical protein MUO72_20335 [Bacteroidales bacterium]|nr:hypothetical protein [Bacteroidales bacterium]